MPLVLFLYLPLLRYYQSGSLTDRTEIQSMYLNASTTSLFSCDTDMIVGGCRKIKRSPNLTQ